MKPRNKTKIISEQLSRFSNEAAVKGILHFFCLFESFLFSARHTDAHAQQGAFARPIFLPSSIALVSTLLAQTRVASSDRPRQ